MTSKGIPRAWSVQDIPDQTGRVALVTGANSGTGLEAAKALAGRGAHVILACRRLERALGAEQAIFSAHPGASLERVELDLGSLDSVGEAARTVLKRHGRLDLLINNAGVMIPPYGRTSEGFELQFGTNHLGHFALTGHLLPLLQATPGSRVVTMSSGVHRVGRIRFEDLHFARGYRAWAAYAQSKIANLMFTFELQRRLARAGSGTLAVAAHPGWSRTELQRHATRNPVMRFLMAAFAPFFSQDAAQGALPLLRAAVDPEAEGSAYYGPAQYSELVGPPVRVQPGVRARDEEVQARLWRVSERLTRVAYPV
ncbi:oxidoreductase [Mesoterricola silvestris]|uniref:Short-chain dehydrogenase n=1 Tax=Mesoterricola silvestris TaxID=2927979 RepID=A0AA48GPJ2_9BACT|nr:oxidoreductase [Mesoterricola silvestris]BDU71790.1 short-chain dehydrogenase [Mesoterricola silvestris]